MPASIELDGLDETLDNLGQLPDEIREELADELNEAAFDGMNVAIKRLTQKQSGYQSGRLRGTIDVRKQAEKEDLEAIVAAGGKETGEDIFDYALAVEFGSKPHFPPVEAVTGQKEGLDIWVRRMDPSPRTEEQQDMEQEELNKQVAFLIAKQMSRIGTKEMPFMRPGFNIARASFKKRVRNLELDI